MKLEAFSRLIHKDYPELQNSIGSWGIGNE